MKFGMARLAALVTVLAVALLVALLLPGVLGGVERHEWLRARVERLQIGESRFRELVISLRHGFSNNYDEGNFWQSRLREERRRLREEMQLDPELRPWSDAYLKAMEQQDEDWEDFKRRNAMVRNSLRYFQSDARAFLADLPGFAGHAALHEGLLALNNTLFLHALGESGDAGGEASLYLEGLRRASSGLPAATARDLDRLLRHARVVIQHSPGLDADVRDLIHGEGRAALARLAETNHTLLLAEQGRAGRYRASLMVSVVLLGAALALLAFNHVRSLRARARELRLAGAVFDSSQQGIIVTDERGDIVQVNPAFCRISGYDQEELIGRNPRILKSGLQDRGFYQAMWAALEQTGRWQGELKNRRKNGEHYVEWINIDAIRTEQGERLYIGISSDISELVTTRERLANLAYFDTLTNLPNRVLFRDRLLHSMAQCRREHVRLALILVDLDNFKTVNDTLGHAAGDEMLQQVAVRLQECVRDSDTVARLGGDEFALILMDAKGPEEMARVAGEVVASLAMPYRLMGFDVPGGASLGIAFYPDDGQNLEELLKHADVAMYRAKERGRNDFQFFTDDMAHGVAENLRIESSLRQALENGELSLHYQPQVDPTGAAHAAEALMRWESPALGRVSPARFIPVAEKSGLIAALGDFALREACRQCARWRADLDPAFRVAVNLSAAQFRHEGLAEKVADVLRQFALPGSALELEITESVVMEDVGRGQAVLHGLKELGCRLAIDDFGTGYSSLAYLKRFPVDVLKIDKSFVDGVGQEADDTAVAQAIIGLAASLRLAVVAEGVETPEQWRALLDLAAHSHDFQAQGYWFAKPMPAAEFAVWLEREGAAIPPDSARMGGGA